MPEATHSSARCCIRRARLSCPVLRFPKQIAFGEIVELVNRLGGGQP
jgi:hypothetical protein